jgi:hypothetical protein
MQRRYVFEGTLFSLHVRERGDHAPPGAERGSAFELRTVFEHPRNAAERARFLRDLGLPSVPAGAVDAAGTLEVEDRLTDVLARRFDVYRVEQRRVVVAVERQEVPVVGPETEPTSWIEIELVDDGGDPVESVEYRVECPDGSVRSGTTDSKGRAREDGLKPGDCKVSFPEIHGPDCTKAA